MGGLSPFSLLLLIFIYCLTVYASTAMTLAQACLDSPSMCKKISLSDISSEDALKNKRFLRPGRALSGDAFLRFGKSVGPDSAKGFIRFGKGDRTVEEMVKEYLENAILTNSNSRQKRSTDVMPQNTIQDDNSKITKRNAETSDNSLDKKFMKFGKSNDLPYVNEWSDKRFMRFGREPDKRFMRFGKSDNKRFMRFGRNPYDLDDRIEEAKRFMRFGRANDVEDKRFMRFGRDPDYDNFGEDKRFMRFGRVPSEADAEKRFMRFGRSVNAVKPDISKEDANE